MFINFIGKFLNFLQIEDLWIWNVFFSTEMCVPTNRIHLTSNVDIYESEDNIRFLITGFYIKKRYW